jgi:hypothetical protein
VSDQLQKLVQDVAVLKEQNQTSETIHGRLDSAIDKLTDIQSGVKSMLAVHEERLIRAEESDAELTDVMEQRNRLWQDDLKELHGRITSTSRDFIEINNEHEKVVIKKVDDVQQYFILEAQKFDKRLSELERWKWIIIGISVAVGISVSPVSNILTSMM